MKEGDAVWVLSGPGIPVGARVGTVAGEEAAMQIGERIWVSICIMGQHLPQMYRPSELTILTPAACATLGLCADCLGYGTTETEFPDRVSAAGHDLPGWFIPRTINEVDPCKTCSGTGRPALRCEVIETRGSMEGKLEFLPHDYVKPLASTLQACLACGMPERQAEARHREGP